ncbi:hypothetical protein Sjap_018432 [Stephania japonica]|uniref:Uncharacterized protein n=1 Tax=Stephania japonica TaxID=461633 RepID=A0AAP0I7Z6_9MAGN
MAAQFRNLIQDENLTVHFKGKDANAPNAKKSIRGLGGRKAPITNSDRPSPQKMALKKNLLRQNVNFNDQFQHAHIENFNAGREGKFIKPASQKREGLGGGRKALSNITNKPSSSVNTAKKNHHAEKVIDIDKEQFFHNHDECIKSLKWQVNLDKRFGFGDDLAIPVVSSSRQKDAIVKSPPMLLMKLEDIEELSPVKNAFPSPSPAQSLNISTPMFALRSPISSTPIFALRMLNL